MRKSKCVRALSLLLALVTVFGVAVAIPGGALRASAASASTDGSNSLSGLLNAQSYDTYAGSYTQHLEAQKTYTGQMPEIEIDLFDDLLESDKEKLLSAESGAFGSFFPDAGAFYRIENLDGAEALFTPDSGSITWAFEVPQLHLKGGDKNDSGYLYMLQIEYYPIVIKGKENVATIERALSIGRLDESDPNNVRIVNQRIPFSEARTLSFTKNWVYGHTDENGNAVPAYKTNGSTLFEPIEGNDYYAEGNKGFIYDKDKGGNDLRYTAMQSPKWMTYTAKDVDGFYQGNFYFYFEASSDKHTITISGSRENLAIKSIKLVPAQYDNTITYAEYLEKYKNKPDAAANGGKITVLQAEFPTNVSDTSVYPANDRSSPITQPSTPASQLMNTIGADSYNTVGQWASYKFTVSESGWYNMTMRYRQSLLDGLFVSRAVKLAGGDYGAQDGTPTVPFQEAYSTRFNYSKDWKAHPIGTVINGQDTEFKFYFEKGVEYTVSFEVSLGDLSEYIKRVQDSLNVINACYLNIIKLTGANPDQYRDYGFNEIMPETIRAMKEQAKELQAVADKFVELAGSKGSQVATLEQIVFLLDKMASKESEVAKNLSNLKSNIGTLGTWLNSVKQQGLLFDYVNVHPVGAEKPRENANIFETIWFEIRAFFVSFFVDYNSMGVKEDAEIEENAGIDVWLAYGRDQSLIWRNLIDTEFTPKEDIPVRLKLVTAGTLLPSVLSGRGPDVYIGLASSDVINYAIREAVEPVEELPGYITTYGYDVNLTDKKDNSYERIYYVDPYKWDADAEAYVKNPDVKDGTYYTNDPAHPPKEYKDAQGNTRLKYEVKPEAIVFNYANTIPISLLGKTYGVPETTNFPMMFYRMDVLAELQSENTGVGVPETWDDLLESITALQSNNMQVGLTYGTAMTTFVYQNGGSQWLYEDDSDYADKSLYDPAYAGAQIGLGTNIALDAFRFCCRLYTEYSFPVTFDAANRFRTGEMPIIITDYCTMYNQLTVFATEIRGLWSFAPLPGFHQKGEDGKLLYNEDGSKVINNCAVSNLTATVMLHKGDNERQEDAWAYMKWQAGADAQASYGNQMVAIVGPAAKYATANNQALENLSWTSSELASLREQFKNLAAVPNFPGSYIIARYIEFAFLAAVNEKADPVTELSSYLTVINKELTRKREEFDMVTLGDGETPPGFKVPKD